MTKKVLLLASITPAVFASNITDGLQKCKNEYQICETQCKNRYKVLSNATGEQKESVEKQLQGCLFRCKLTEKGCEAKVKAKEMFKAAEDWLKGFLNR